MAHTSAKKGINKVSGVPMIDMDVLVKEETEFLTKALTKDDAPPKEKHVRSAVVATYQENGCTVFFSVVESRLNNWTFTVPIVGYKMLYMYHRLLRDGHPRVLKQSKGRYFDIVKRMKTGFNYKDDFGYCNLVMSYCAVIMNKINFHLRHEEFPGLIREEGEQLAVLQKPDMNHLFELLSELLDFLDSQVSLMDSIHKRLDPSAKLPTSHTHCVIHPLLNLVPESFSTMLTIEDIYLCLATKLDSDTLSGHRKRFAVCHSNLQRILAATGQLSYIMSILRVMPTLPKLPEEVTSPKPVILKVRLPRKEAPPPMARDFSRNFDFQSENTRDRQITSLTKQVADLTAAIEKLKEERMGDHQLLFDKTNEVQMVKNELAELKQENVDLKEQVSLAAAAADVTDQMKAANERYSRVKEIYTKLRDDHVALIRQKAQSDKKVSTLTDRNGDLQAEKEALTESLATAQEEQKLLQENLRSAEAHAAGTQSAAHDMEKETGEKIADLEQQLADRAEEVESLKTSLANASVKEQGLEERCHTAETTIAEMEKSAADAEQNSQESISLLRKDLAKREAEVEKLSARCSQQETDAARLASDLAAAQDKVTALTVSSSDDKDASSQKIESLESLLSKRQVELQTLTSTIDAEQQKYTKLEAELALARELAAAKDRQLAEAQEAAASSQASMAAQLEEERKRRVDTSHAVLVSSLEAAQQDVNEAGGSRSGNVAASALVERSQSALNRCSELQAALIAYHADHTTVPAASVSVSHASNALCRVIEDANSVSASNASTDMVDQVHHLTDVVVAGFETLKAREIGEEDIVKAMSSVRDIVAAIHKEAKDLVPAEQKQIEEVGRSVESEMNMMAEAVMQAAKKIEEMMERSKETDTGEQREVNSRILDSSSELMKAIRKLIADARELQNEIVQDGRGTLTADQFYQKNSRWTEGLLSAAKMVGHGAQHLVECADNVVTGQGKFEELEVASHEIAASTAQLVAASKAKASRNSKLLSTLKGSSKIVTEKTGHVVVSAKSGVKAKKRAEQPDFTKLSALQGKRAEMEIQVRLLELETEVEHTRNQLGEIRRLGYSGSNKSPMSSGKTSPF